MATQPRTCADCGSPLSPRNTSGYCGRHVGAANMRRPEIRARMVNGIRRRLASDPVLREQYRANIRKAHQSPKAIAKRKERWAKEKPWIAGNAAQPAGSEPRKRMAATISATKLAWCPPHLRDAYRALTRKGHRAAEARRMILEQHETDMRRFRQSIGAEQPPTINVTPSKGVLFIDRASAVAAQWAGVPDIWVRSRDQRIVRARWAVYLVLRRANWTPHRISAETGMERKGVEYALAKAEILATAPGEFADLVRKVSAA